MSAVYAVASALAEAAHVASADAALEQIGPRFGADRAWLIRFDPDMTQFWVSHEWCADGVAAFLPDFPGAPISLLARPLLELRRGRPVVYADVEKIPSDAQDLKEEMRREGNRATAGAPLFRDGRLVALIGLDDVRKIHRWSAGELALLGRLGELVLAAANRVVLPPATAAGVAPPPPAPNGCYLRAGNSHIQVSWHEIVSITAEGDYTRVRLQNGRRFLESRSLAVWAAMLPKEFFGRVHRSCIVGWRHVERIHRGSGGHWTLHLTDLVTALPVGRLYRSAVRLQVNLSGNQAARLAAPAPRN